MTTQDFSFSESRLPEGRLPDARPAAGATRAEPGLPPEPGPASARPARPVKAFASVIDQAIRGTGGQPRKPAHTRATRSAAAREANSSGRRAGSVDRAGSAAVGAAPAKVVRVSKAGPGSDAVERPTDDPLAGGKMRKEPISKPEDVENPTDASAEDGIEVEKKFEGEDVPAEAASKIVAFPGLAVAQTVIIPFPLAAAKAISPVTSAESIDGISLGTDSPMGDVPLLLFPSAPAVGEKVENVEEVKTGSGSETAVAPAKGVAQPGPGEVATLGLKPVEGPAQFLSTTGKTDPDATVKTSAASAVEQDVPAQSDAVVSVDFREAGSAGFGDDSGGQGRNAESHLPEGSEVREDSAQPAESVVASAKDVSLRFETVKAPVHTGFPRVQNLTTAAAEGAGTSAAWQESRMESMSNPEAAARQANSTAAQSATEALEEFQSAPTEPVPVEGQDLSARNLVAMDWQTGRLVGSVDRPAPDSSSATSADASAAVERISKMVMGEVSLVRKHGSDAMAVVLRPDAETELFIHFTQRNGQVEATIRCERGDAQHLSTLWPQLQESLAQQKVRLAPLQESPSNQPNFNQPSGPGQGGGENAGGNNSARQSSRDEQFMDERPVSASSQNTPHVRGGGGSRHRRVTTSRPGWETWA